MCLCTRLWNRKQATINIYNIWTSFYSTSYKTECQPCTRIFTNFSTGKYLHENTLCSSERLYNCVVNVTMDLWIINISRGGHHLQQYMSRMKQFTSLLCSASTAWKFIEIRSLLSLLEPKNKFKITQHLLTQKSDHSKRKSRYEQYTTSYTFPVIHFTRRNAFENL